MSHSTTSGGGRVDLAVARDGQDLAALAQAGADGAAQVGDRAERIGAQPARAAQVERQHQAADFALGLGDFGGAHRLEVHPLQALAVGDGQHRVLDCGGSSSCAAWRVARRRHRLGDAAAAGGGARPASSPSVPPAAPSRRPARRRWDRARTGRRPGRTRPGARGGGSSRCAARCAPRSCCRDRPARAPAAPAMRLGRPDRQPGAAQQPREVHDVGGEGGAGEGGGREGGGWRGHRVGGRRTRARGGRKGCVRARQAARQYVR